MLIFLITVTLAVAGASLAVALFRHQSARGLYIDPQRVTLEEVRLRRVLADMDDDPDFRAQVKRRMLEGEDCEIKPWYEGRRPTARFARRNVVALTRGQQ